MPDYLDDLVHELHHPTAAEEIQELQDLQEALDEGLTPAESPGEPSGPTAPGAAGGPEERREQRVAGRGQIAAGAGAAAATGAMLAQPGGEDLGHAAGAVEGRMMAVMPPEGGQSEDALAAIAGILGTIAVLGLPAKGAVTTTAVGSKL